MLDLYFPYRPDTTQYNGHRMMVQGCRRGGVPKGKAVTSWFFWGGGESQHMVPLLLDNRPAFTAGGAGRVLGPEDYGFTVLVLCHSGFDRSIGFSDDGTSLNRGDTQYWLTGSATLRDGQELMHTAISTRRHLCYQQLRQRTVLRTTCVLDPIFLTG